VLDTTVCISIFDTVLLAGPWGTSAHQRIIIIIVIEPAHSAKRGAPEGEAASLQYMLAWRDRTQPYPRVRKLEQLLIEVFSPPRGAASLPIISIHPYLDDRPSLAESLFLRPKLKGRNKQRASLLTLLVSTVQYGEAMMAVIVMIVILLHASWPRSINAFNERSLGFLLFVAKLKISATVYSTCLLARSNFLNLMTSRFIL
jgi:hypothetical protein